MAEQRKKLRLGELLVQQGLITTDQLSIVLAEQRHNNIPIGRLLVRLGFVTPGLTFAELHDLLHLAVSGEIEEPSSELGVHVTHHWEDLTGPGNQSFVHWLLRLVFRGAWLDQRVKEGELDIVFDERRQTFGYIQPDRGPETIELAKEPSWRRVAFRR